MRSQQQRRVICALVFLAATLHAQAPDDAADVARLVEVLNLHPNSVVADIGAGAGPLTTGIAPHVAAGKVYATDIASAQLQMIRDAATRAGLTNVTVLEGGPSQTNLPDASCDGIFMRDVYHHFGDPPAMNGSLLKSLKPGGRVAVIDFVPRSGHTAAPGKRDQGADHGILPADVISELKAAGFTDVQEVMWPSRGYFAVAGTRPH